MDFMKLPIADWSLMLQVKLPITPTLEFAYKTLYSHVEEVLNRSAYRVIDFSKIFKFALTNSRPKMSASQRSIVEVQKKLANI